MVFIICLAAAAVGILFILLARLFRSYPVAFAGLFCVVGAAICAIFFADDPVMGILWIILSISSVTFSAIWLYKNQRWAFWWGLGSDLALVVAALFRYPMVQENVVFNKHEWGTKFDVNLSEILNYSKDNPETAGVPGKYGLTIDETLEFQDVIFGQIIIHILVPILFLIIFSVVADLIFCLLLPKLMHKDKNERHHRTNIDPLIGQHVKITKEKEEGRSQRGYIGDVDWAIEPFFPYESFKVGDVVKVYKIKGVTLLCIRDGKDYRKEMRDKRKAEAEKARKAREEAQAKKAVEAVEPAKEEPKVEEPAPVAEPAPVVEPAPVEEAKPVKAKAEFVPFSVRLKEADDFVRESYNELKSEVLSYGIKSRVSSTGDTFRLHTKAYVKMVVAGKYLKLYYALNPADYKDTTYPFEDASRMGAHKDTPFVFKIKSGLSVRRAKVLIADAAKKDELVQREVVAHDHAKDVIEGKVMEKPAKAEKPAKEEKPAKIAKEKAKPAKVEKPKAEKPAKPVEKKAEKPVEKKAEPKVEVKPEPTKVEEVKAPKEKAEFVPFSQRIKEADEFVRVAYNELKSEVLSYGIKSRVSGAGDVFRLHTKPYVKMVVAGKYLKLYLALNPEDYKDTTYPFEDASKKNSQKDTPFVFKIKSELSIRRAKVLIADAAKKDGLVQGEIVKHDHAADLE